MVVAKEKAEEVLAVLKKKNEMAAIIGQVSEENVGKVVIRTEFGGQTLLAEASGELLPRIC